ncbi:hypothetical protein [Tunicatimonas pelagia]|uniref:hypothetical protein n=1 Tax=Tunicatimonas pelagia TaxID=931531 RepID=UPI002666C52E|nr:hypothetical protein [Tunicatimonas pelagia]WKN41212.1 hypothetical protein P0M28_19435 [Tunicatimonas pelagia]
MRELVLSVIAFLAYSLASTGYAQDWSFAIGPGVTQYLGDVNDQKLGGNRWAINAEGWYRLTDNLHIKSGVSLYQLSAQDADPVRLRSFRSTNFEFYSSAMYSFKRGFFTPFAYAGLGATTSSPRGDSRLGYFNLRDVEPEAERVPGLVGMIPFGVGVDYELTPVLSLVVDLALRYTFSDRLDAMRREMITVDDLSPLAREYYAALSEEQARAINEESFLRGGNSANNDLYGILSVKVRFTPTSALFGCVDPYKYARPTHKRKVKNYKPL